MIHDPDQSTLFEMPDRSQALIRNFIHECSDVSARRHLQRVLECGQNHLLFQTATGFETAPMVCNSRWCGRCSKARALLMASNLTSQLLDLHVQRESIINGELKSWREKVSKEDLRHFTFTIQSVGYHRLRLFLIVSVVQFVKSQRFCRKTRRFISGRSKLISTSTPFTLIYILPLIVIILSIICTSFGVSRSSRSIRK